MAQREPYRRRATLHGMGQPDRIHDFGDPYPQAPTQDLPLWIYPPINWENLDQIAYAALPAPGAGDATILSFQVPLGRNGIINKIANNFVGGGWTEGSGAVLWRILVDGAPPPGANSYDAIAASLGSPAQPVAIAGFRIFENQVVSVVVNNVSVVLAAQVVGARLVGYLYPRELEDPNIFI